MNTPAVDILKRAIGMSSLLFLILLFSVGLAEKTVFAEESVPVMPVEGETAQQTPYLKDIQFFPDGYVFIPVDTPFMNLPDEITPQIVQIIEQKKDQMMALGEIKTNEDGESVESGESIDSQYITWKFQTYTEPDFSSEKSGSYLPQTVAVKEQRDDGWALIETADGARWVYTAENKILLDKHAVMYEDMSYEKPSGTITPQTVKVLKQIDSWVLIETDIGERWIDLNALRPYVRLDVPLFDQRGLGYPTGCEIVSLGMMINYKVEANVEALVSQMPYSHDPRAGFRGNPASKGGFTILPEALLDLTEVYLGSAHDLSGTTMLDLKRKLNAEVPVVVWVNGLGFNVHAICLSGYDENGFYYNDPWKNRKDAFITYDAFYAIWNKPVYDKQLRISYPPRLALSYNP